MMRFIPIIILFAFVFFTTITISIFLMGFSLRSNQNNESIKSFIKFAKGLPVIPNNSIVWGNLKKVTLEQKLHELELLKN